MTEPAEARSRERGSVSGPRKILEATQRLLQQRDLRVVLVCSAVLGLAVSFVLPFLSLFATQAVGMSLGAFGAFMTVTALSNIVLSTLLAHRSDALASRRGMLLWGSAAGALGYLGYAVTRDVFALVLIGAFVLGVASITFSQLFAHARELLERTEIPAHEAPLYMNAFRMCFALSWTVGPAIAAEMLRRWSFLGLFAGASGLYVLLFLLVLGFVAKGTGSVRATSSNAPPGAQAERKARTLLSSPKLLFWFVAFVLVFAAHTMSISNMSLFVLGVLHGNGAHVGVIFSLAPLFELPFMLYFGLLATRIESSRLMFLAFGLAVLYYGALSCVRTPQQIYPLQFLSAAIVSVTSGVAITFFQNKFPGRLGTSTNLYSNASRLGSTSGYLVFGVSAAQFGHRGVYLVCAFLLALALLLGTLGERTREHAF
jgi:MFS transporter, SET family, sugar efflux transporter